MGSFGKGSPAASQQTSTTRPDPAVAEMLYKQMGNAANIAQTPYNLPVAPVAGFSQDQNSAFQGVRGMQGAYQPWLNTAAGYGVMGAAPAWQTMGNYYNPFQQQVIDTTMAKAREMQGQQQQGLTSQLIGSPGGPSAWGGDRAAIAKAALQGQHDIANNQTIAGLNLQGFNTALGAANQDAARAGQAAYTFGNLGQEQQQLGLSGYGALLNTGGLQQQLAQAQMNAPYQWEVARQAYPFQTASWLSSLYGQLAPLQGSTTTQAGTQMPASPSPLSQGIGLGMMGLGAYNSRNPVTASANPGGQPTPATGVGEYSARGGRIGYDDGGSIGDHPFWASPGVVPSVRLSRGQAPQAAPPLKFAEAPKSGMPDIGALSKGLGGLKSIFGGSGATSAAEAAGAGAADAAAGAGAAEGAGFLSSLGSTLSEALPFLLLSHGGRAGYEEGGITPPNQRVASGFSDVDDAVDKGIIQPQGAFGYVPQDDSLPQGAGYTEAAPDQMQLAGVNGQPSVPSSLLSPSGGILPPVEEGQDTGPEATGTAPWPEKPDFGQALMAAGLGMLGGTSPFPGVNIGQGGLKGLENYKQQQQQLRQDAAQESLAKYRESQAKLRAQQIAKQLAIETAKIAEAKRQHDLMAGRPFKLGVDKYGRDVYGVRDPESPNGYRVLNPGEMAGKPLTGTTPPVAKPAVEAGSPPATEASQPKEEEFPTVGPKTKEEPVRLAMADTGMSFTSDVPFPIAKATPAEEKFQTQAIERNKAVVPGAVSRIQAVINEDRSPPSDKVNPKVLEENPEWANVIKAVAENRRTIGRGFDAKTRTFLNRMVQDYYPEYDEGQFARRNKTINSFATGVEGRNVTALNTVMGHVEELYKAGKALDNFKTDKFGIASKKANEWRQWVLENKQDPRVIRYQIAANAVANELEKAFRGANTAVSGVREWKEKIRTALSPEEQKGAMSMLAGILGKRIESVGQQYSTGMGKARDGLDLLTPENRALFNRMGSGFEESKASAPAGPPQKHIDRLKEYRDNPAALREFDAKYGEGAAKKYLGQ